MLLQPIDERDRELFINFIVFSDQDKSEIGMNPALDSMRAEAQIDVPRAAHHGVVLIERIVQALVEVVQVAQDDRVTQFHGNFDPVDVEADLTVLLVVSKT